jgi:hypothetical protein
MSAEATIQGMHTHVATINGTHWPAWEYDAEHVIVDLRLFKSGAQALEKAFRPEELQRIGIPQETIDAAAKCEPIQGFCLMPRKRSAA